MNGPLYKELKEREHRHVRSWLLSICELTVRTLIQDTWQVQSVQKPVPGVATLKSGMVYRHPYQYSSVELGQSRNKTRKPESEQLVTMAAAHTWVGTTLLNRNSVDRKVWRYI